MAVLEFALILLACVIASAVIAQVVRRFSLPLVQIAVGFLVALVLPTVHDVYISSELFLVLFIAPLLFNEARHSNPRTLWEHKGAILSLAVGLVLLTVLVVGFVLHWFVPSISLAAAFAVGAALAPTDAAAVGSLSGSVNLRKRQNALLSGESLINDASGVVAFQFASAAAVTGAFSAVDAGAEFLQLFFGGIAVGAALGGIGRISVYVLHRFGFESTTVHVLYEVFTPFVIFLFAEWIEVSGILAVVAAGLMMADRTERLTSTTAAHQQVVSDGFWDIVVFLINAVIFILLGMQLPQALTPAIADSFSLPFLLVLVALTTALIMGCRFLWVLVMEIIHRVVRRRHHRQANKEKGSSLEIYETNAPSPTPHLREKPRHWRERISSLLRNAAVLTIGGPKGAVTLSIIFTLPASLADGSAFPNHDLLIFLVASVILCTLLLADSLLPKLAPREPDGVSENDVRLATIKVLEGTIDQLQGMLASGDNRQYAPALRLTIAHYRVRLLHEREAIDDGCSHQLEALGAEVREVQEKKAATLHEQGGYRPEELAPYYAMLRGVRRSVGYDGSDVNVGSRFNGLRGQVSLLRLQAHPLEFEDEQSERVYYDTCLFAISLEHAAIDYLNDVIAQDDSRRGAAEVLLREHRTALASLWDRINYGQSTTQEDHTDITLDHHDSLPEGMKPLFGKQLAEANRYANEVDANALTIELDQIRHLLDHGEISLAVANELRQRVYVLQMTLGDSAR